MDGYSVRYIEALGREPSARFLNKVLNNRVSPNLEAF